MTKHTTPIYRVRKGWNNKSILQKLVSLPTFHNGAVDTHNRQSKWVDVPYDGSAPHYIAQPKEKEES